MDIKAVESYYADCNCAQCMLRAAEQYYGLKISDDAYKMCGGLCAGFGIGCFCNALVAGIMLFGLMADEDTVKRMRLKLLTDFNEKFHDFNCAKLKEDKDGCDELIRFTAEKIREIIDTEA